MSERTTIGGTVYESIGSSTSNLLLKSNGTVRVQWGTKLIDLIKNGKIASGNSDFQVSVVEDESEIKSDGVFILKVGDSEQLWIRKDGNKYNLTGTDLYISATTKQNITGEQKEQALSNIGMYFQSYEDLQNSNIKNGIAYVISDKSLYTIQDGLISEFEAKLKTVTVEEQEEIGEVINSSTQIILSILDEAYLILSDKRITANYDVHIKPHAQLGSEGANEAQGYRLYIDGDYACLDVDKINVRNGIPSQSYIQTTYTNLLSLIANNNLQKDKWYLISDFQNHWKLSKKSDKNNRPILVQAKSNNTLYSEGKLFDDQKIIINYDHTFNDVVIQSEENDSVSSRGRITWMKDTITNNEANFDFLDYTDVDGEPLTTLHIVDENSSIKSIFPKNSYNNTLVAYDLKGIVLKEGLINNEGTTTIDFQYDDSDTSMEMHDNYIECRGLTLLSSCTRFYENTLKNVCNLSVASDFSNNNVETLYTTTDRSTITSFVEVEDNNIFDTTQFNTSITDVKIGGFINSTLIGTLDYSDFGVIEDSIINNSIYNSTFKNITGSELHCQFESVQFENLTDCVFQEGTLFNIKCEADLESTTFDNIQDILLYDYSKKKEIYSKNNVLHVTCPRDHYFIRGMIMMYSGLESDIPMGWGICDGSSYTFDGVTTITPDLRNRFIKAVSSESDLGAFNNYNDGVNNEFQLTSDHLPEHNHPHKEHTHTLGDIVATTELSGELSIPISYTDNTVIVSSDPASVVSEVSGEGITSVSTEVVGSVSSTSVESSTNGSLSGANHSHDVYISGVSVSDSTSEEDTQTWVNKAFKIEPNYYSLIFIMKL